MEIHQSFVIKIEKFQYLSLWKFVEEIIERISIPGKGVWKRPYSDFSFMYCYTYDIFWMIPNAFLSSPLKNSFPLISPQNSFKWFDRFGISKFMTYFENNATWLEIDYFEVFWIQRNHSYFEVIMFLINTYGNVWKLLFFSQHGLTTDKSITSLVIGMLFLMFS